MRSKDAFTGTLSDLLIAATEACANAILHADTDHVSVGWEAEGDRATIVIQDDGVFRPLVGFPELDGRGHRGIQLMMASMDEVDILQGTRARPGTRVTMTKRKAVPART